MNGEGMDMEELKMRLEDVAQIVLHGKLRWRERRGEVTLGACRPPLWAGLEAA